MRAEGGGVKNANLGRLERVDLRDIWATEAQHFTPWLAREENLQILGESLAIDLEFEAQEKNVGPFRADILCKDTDNGSWVLIENQLERTDHLHLGQLLTYAAGLNVVTIVWIAANFTEEHRATLDWLNEITDDSFQFFGLEVELWRIGDSPAAPKFNIVSKPNDWSRSVSKAAKQIGDQPLTETKAAQLEYWMAFREHLESVGSLIKAPKPFPQHWMNFGIGRTSFLLGALLNTTEERIGVELYINHADAKSFFWQLHADKEAIEGELGFPLEWCELPDRKASRLVRYWQGVNPLDRNRWPEYCAWMQKGLEDLSMVFRPRIKVLSAEDWVPVTGDEDA